MQAEELSPWELSSDRADAVVRFTSPVNTCATGGAACSGRVYGDHFIRANMREVTELLSLVRSTYATASRYRDSGRVQLAGGALDGAVADFATRFERRGQILSLEYSSEETGAISLSVTGDRIEIMPPCFKASNLAGAIATLTGVTMTVAHNVFSMLLPEQIAGPAPCAEGREFSMKDGRSGGIWVLESAAEPRVQIAIGQDMLLREYRIHGIVTGRTDVVIAYRPELWP